MYPIWCEWDIGQGSFVFKTREAAFKWMRESTVLTEILEEEGGDLDLFHTEGLIGLTELTVVE